MIACLILTSDLMLQSQVAQVAKSAGISCRAVGAIESLATEANSPDVRMVIVDLQSVPAEKLAEMADQLHQRTDPPLCIAVGPHVYKQLLERGTSAGWFVMTRGQLHSQLGQYLQQLLT